MKVVKFLGLVATLALAAVAWSGETMEVDGSDVTFEKSVTRSIGDSDVTLTITGTALREKAWFNVYAIASYVQEGSGFKSAEELAGGDVPKLLHLVMERDVGGKKMANAFQEAIEANYSASEFTDEMKSFSAYFMANEAKEGMNITFTNVPGMGLACQVGDAEVLKIENPSFSNAVWDIYLGKENIGDGIKKSLIAGL